MRLSSKRNMGSGLRIRDPGTGIRKKPVSDPGVKKAPDPGSVAARLKKRVKQDFDNTTVLHR
jgi:hypothetical protein